MTSMTPGWPQMTPYVPLKSQKWLVYPPSFKYISPFILMTSDHDPWMTSDDPKSTSKKSQSGWCLYTHQVSSPYMTLNTNMTSDDPRMTSDDPGCTFGKFDSGWRLHPLSFKSILALYTKYDLRWPQDDLRWPQNLINPSGCEDAHTDQVPSSYVLWTWDIVFTRLFQKMNKLWKLAT